MRHSVSAELGHSEIKRALRGITGLNDACIGQAKIAANGSNAKRFHVIEHCVFVESKAYRAPSVFHVAMTAIRMEIGNAHVPGEVV